MLAACWASWRVGSGHHIKAGCGSPACLCRASQTMLLPSGNIVGPEAKGKWCCLLLRTPCGGEGSGVWGALGW